MTIVDTAHLVGEEVDVEFDGPIQESVPRDEVKQMPYALPKDFEWCTLDLTQADQIQELYELLT